MGKKNARQNPAARQKNSVGRLVGGNHSSAAVVEERLRAVRELISRCYSSRAIVQELSARYEVHSVTVYEWLKMVRNEMRLAARQTIKHRLEICLADTIKLRDEARAEGEYGTAANLQKELNALLCAQQASEAQIEAARAKADEVKVAAHDVEEMTSGQIRALLAEIFAADKTAQ